MTGRPVAVCPACGGEAVSYDGRPAVLIHAAPCSEAGAWTEDAITEFERSIHPPSTCPVGGCAACYEPRRPSERTAHRALCVDEDGQLECVCGIGYTR